MYSSCRGIIDLLPDSETAWKITSADSPGDRNVITMLNLLCFGWMGMNPTTVERVTIWWPGVRICPQWSRKPWHQPYQWSCLIPVRQGYLSACQQLNLTGPQRAKQAQIKRAQRRTNFLWYRNKLNSPKIMLGHSSKCTMQLIIHNLRSDWLQHALSLAPVQLHNPEPG